MDPPQMYWFSPRRSSIPGRAGSGIMEFHENHEIPWFLAIFAKFSCFRENGSILGKSRNIAKCLGNHNVF